MFLGWGMGKLQSIFAGSNVYLSAQDVEGAKHCEKKDAKQFGNSLPKSHPKRFSLAQPLPYNPFYDRQVYSRVSIQQVIITFDACPFLVR